MGSATDAQNAINELNDYQLGGRGVTVNEARPKMSTGGGPRGGGPRRRSEPR